ncbi:hypothetical protein [Microbacterium sp. Root166]|uniref:hypothetical protein n=1 Tax=Microbacterium sp. Root166 TaxID=1736478 RepID=UPI000A538707|nr:hypothetical protein [Microbacterium sp. Root166]
MDAAERAELGELRRRAFGPAPDIEADAVSLARLIELEELALHEREPLAREVDAEPEVVAPETPPASSTAAELPAPAHDAAVSDADVPEVSPQPAPAPTSRRGRVAFAAVVGVAAIAAAGVWLSGPGDPSPVAAPNATPTLWAEASPPSYEGREQFSFAQDSDAVEVMRIWLGGYFGQTIDASGDEYVPDFPTSGVVTWASPLGEYYGWDLWIAGADGMIQREHCLLIEQGSERRSRCVPAALRPNAALIVSVPFAVVIPEERPSVLDDGERLGFWWGEDDAIVVLVGDDPAL